MVHKPKSYAIKYIAVFVLLTSLVLAGCSSDSDKDETSHGSKSSGKVQKLIFLKSHPKISRHAIQS
jgi:ABC-type oligopeptide transport system substrate-binding subunit